jgi:Domain of unknown function (DUF4386)
MNKPLETKTRKTKEWVDPHWRGLILAGGILMIVIPLISLYALYLARTLYAPGYPSDAAGYLQLVAQHHQLFSLTWSLWIITDILGLAPVIAMYIVLQKHNRALALLGSLLAIFYAIYDVSATELNSLTLVSLAHGYASATSDALRASFVAAATYGYHALPLQSVLSFGIGSLGYLLWCVPMWKSFFGRWTTIFGVIVNVIGVIGSASFVVPAAFILGICLLLAPRLIALWSIVLGVQMFRYGSRLPANTENSAGMSQKVKLAV